MSPSLRRYAWMRACLLRPRPAPQSSGGDRQRRTPCLYGLYSLVALLGHALHPDGPIPTQPTAWYTKSAPTFSDVVATVRRHLWGNFDYALWPAEADIVLIPRHDLARLAFAVCY